MVCLFCKDHVYILPGRAVSFLLVMCVAPGTICPQRFVIESSLLLIVIKHFHSCEQELSLGKTGEKASLGD